jgi:FkbM family methyltransferase
MRYAPSSKIAFAIAKVLRLRHYNLIAKLWAISPQFLRKIYYWDSGDRTLAQLLIPDMDEIVKIQIGICKGTKLKLNLRNERGYFLGTHEWESQKILLKFLKEGMTAYNIGAHIGFYTVGLSHLIGPTGKIVAFEPNPGVYIRLVENISINNLLNVSAYECAVSDFDGLANFSVSLSDSQGRFSHLPYVKDGHNIQVLCKKIDTFINEGGPVPNFIKIDVEHAEGSVFRGMIDTLNTYRPIILVELHGAEAISESWDVLDKCNYKMARIPDLSFISKDEISYGQYFTAHESFFKDYK